MNDILNNALPFISRDHLKFGKESLIELVVVSVSNGTRVITIRGATRSGIIGGKHTSGSNFSRNTTRHRIDDIPIFFAIIPDFTATAQGSIFITVTLAIDGVDVMPLASGQIYTQKPLQWPSAAMEDVKPGRGLHTDFVLTTPSAGDDYETSTTANRLMHLLYGRVRLITDATVANRRMHLEVISAAGPTINTWAADDQAASTTRFYHFVQLGAVPDTADDDDIFVPLPADLWVRGESVIGTKVTNIQSGDALTFMSFAVEQFFQGQ